MSLANPLGKAAFADQLRVASVKFTLGFRQEASATGGGDTLYADRAPARWMAEVATVPMTHGEAKGLIALLNSRAGGLKTILLYDHTLPFPESDPAGSIFATATPEVDVITDRLHVSFAAFPAGYVLPLGTYLQILYDTDRYYLGQVVEARTADGSGDVATVEVFPPLPAAIVSGDAVTVLKPSAEFRVVPGSAFVSVQSAVNSTVAFSAEQAR